MRIALYLELLAVTKKFTSTLLTWSCWSFNFLPFPLYNALLLMSGMITEWPVVDSVKNLAASSADS